MKKNILKVLALSAFATMILASCGEEKKNSESTKSEEISSVAPASSSEKPASSSTSASSSKPSESSSQAPHEHSYGDWIVESEPSETEDGVEAKVCTCGDKITRAIPHKDIKVNYGFHTEADFTVTEDNRGIHFTTEACPSSGYNGLYHDIKAVKVADATAYTFKILNTAAHKTEFRFAYRDTTVSPKGYANDSNAANYTITSRDGSADTKIREVKDGYVKTQVAAGDMADITIPLTSEVYDQFVIIPIHVEATAFTIISTGYVVKHHNYAETYSFDENQHWKECTDEGCTHTSAKEDHTWVADTSKTDIPATTEKEGTHYEVCSVCGATHEVSTPKIGEATEKNLDLVAHGFKASTHYTVTPEEGGAVKVDYTQNAKGYEPLVVNTPNTLGIHTAKTSTLKIKNLGEKKAVLGVFFQLSDNTNLLERTGQMLSSATSSADSKFERVGSLNAYLHVDAGDTCEFKLTFKADTKRIDKIKLVCDINQNAASTGSVEILNWTILDSLL